MNLLHVIDSVDPRGGGPIEGILQWASLKESRFFNVSIASFDHPSAPYLSGIPVPVYALGNRGLPSHDRWHRLPWVHYGYAPRMIPWLRANLHRYDVVVVNGLWNYSTFAARRVLVGSTIPYYVFTHGMLDPWFKKTYPLKSALKQVFWWFCEGPLLNNARAVLFTTEDERTLAHCAFLPYRLKDMVVGYGTNDVSGDPATQIEAFLSLIPALRNRNYILFLSRIHPKKGCNLLISAFAPIVASHPQVDLVIAGPDQNGLKKGLVAQAQALGISDRIHWPGMLSGDAKWGAFRAAEAFVLPSHQENFGIVVAEAMACGKPVLLTDKVNIWREVLACEAGLVETDTAEGVARLLERYFALSREERDRMGRCARNGFLQRLEIKLVINLIDKIFCGEIECIRLTQP